VGLPIFPRSPMYPHTSTLIRQAFHGPHGELVDSAKALRLCPALLARPPLPGVRFFAQSGTSERKAAGPSHPPASPSAERKKGGICPALINSLKSATVQHWAAFPAGQNGFRPLAEKSNRHFRADVTISTPRFTPTETGSTNPSSIAYQPSPFPISP